VSLGKEEEERGALLAAAAVEGRSSFVAVASPVRLFFPFGASGFRFRLCLRRGCDFVRSDVELQKLDGFVSPVFAVGIPFIRLIKERKCESNP
jgi:hypothetical protein